MGEKHAAESGSGFLDLTRTVGGADVGRTREEMRRGRLIRIIVMVGVPTAYLWYRIVSGNPLNIFNLPSVDPLLLIPSLFFLLLGVLLVGQFVFSGRSPHTVMRPEQIDVRLADVVGIDVVKDEVVRSLQLFLSHRSVRPRDGRPPAPRPALRGRPRHRQDATPPRRSPPRPACRSCSRPPRRSSPASRAPPRARCASTSRRCARRPASRAARSASSTSSTRSAWPATVRRR